MCIALVFAGCKIQNKMESNSSVIDENDPDLGPRVEDAVYITEVASTPAGSVVQCRLNPILVDVPEDIPVFIEFEGVEIERKVFRNEKQPITFAPFEAPFAGELICVVEFVDAEFESQPLFIGDPSAQPKTKKNKGSARAPWKN